MRKQMMRKRKGFTLVETLIVVVLMGVLSLLITQTLGTYSDNAAGNVAVHKSQVSMRDTRAEVIRTLSAAQAPIQCSSAAKCDSLRPDKNTPPLAYASAKCVAFYAYGLNPNTDEGQIAASTSDVPDLVVARVGAATTDSSAQTLNIERWKIPVVNGSQGAPVPVLSTANFTRLCAATPQAPNTNYSIRRSTSGDGLLQPLTSNGRNGDFFTYRNAQGAIITPTQAVTATQRLQIATVEFAGAFESKNDPATGKKLAPLVFSVTLPTAFYGYMNGSN